MPKIIKKCFLYHVDSSVNSDKVFNLFVIDNEDGTYTALSEYGRSGTRLNVRPLAERCSLPQAENRFSDKRFDKVHHRRTPYVETFSCSDSPTVKQYGAAISETAAGRPPATVLDFKSAAPGREASRAAAAEEEISGEQSAPETIERGKRARGALNLNRLDALEL